MGLGAVDGEEEQGRNESVGCEAAGGGLIESEGDAHDVGERVEEETRNGVGEVEVPGVGAPGGGLTGDDVEFEGCEFRPEGELLPEEGVHEDGGGEADKQAEDAGGDDLALDGDATGREEKEGVGCEEDGQFGAEDDAGDGYEVEGEAGPLLVYCRAHGLWEDIS